MAGRILNHSLYLFGLVLFYAGAAGLVRWLGRNNPKVLLYHDCAPAETDYTADLDCTTSPAMFEQHLEYLRRHHAIVDLATIVAGQAPPRSVAITFDDGYRSVYDYAYPLLKSRRIPATIYLISDVIENHRLVWVNELNHAMRAAPELVVPLVEEQFGKPETNTPAAVITHCRLNYHAGRMKSLLERIRDTLDLPVEAHAARAQLYVGWREIEEMTEGGVTFGNHTRTHPNLDRLDEQEQAEEIGGAQAELSKRLPLLRSLAYPFGHHSSATPRIAARLGLESVAEVGGYNRPLHPLRIGRVHLSEQSVAGLFARMEIVEPIKGRMRNLSRKPIELNS